MQPRPSAVRLALITVALVHGWWGVRVLADGEMLMSATQLVSAGGLLLAGVGAASRASLGTGLGIAAAATGLRGMTFLGGGVGPFTYATLTLAAGFALAAYGARSPPAPSGASLQLRGGLALASVAYVGFLGLMYTFGAPSLLDVATFVLRIGGTAVAALCVDAPLPLAKGKRFAEPDAIRAR